MVESRRKASDASDAAGSQQGCSDKRTPGKDMWARSSTEGNVLHSKNAGEPVHVPVSSHRAAWVVSTEYLPFEPLVLLVHWLALADGQNTRESVKPLSYQPVGASMMSVDVVLMSRPCTGRPR